MKQPKVGDRKEVVIFALFPMMIESRFIWFKRYRVVKEYQEWVEYESMLDDHYTVTEWQTVERKLIRR
jgi:hypothetical protein